MDVGGRGDIRGVDLPFPVLYESSEPGVESWASKRLRTGQKQLREWGMGGRPFARKEGDFGCGWVDVRKSPPADQGLLQALLL